MVTLVWNIVLAVVWAALAGGFTGLNLAVGFAVGWIALGFTWGFRGRYFRKAPRLARFVLYYAWEMLAANVRVAFDVATPRHRSRPAIVEIPLEARTDLEIMLLANLINLTPGTLALDLSDDGRTLYVHGMFVDDVERFRADIKNGLERRLLEVLR